MCVFQEVKHIKRALVEKDTRNWAGLLIGLYHHLIFSVTHVLWYSRNLKFRADEVKAASEMGSHNR